ncbi:histone H1-like [Armigeres subalbatus]|uniref:histone H1-like n=1 Tax=Armigeres subalbatus TaxID=124917 RepID=UPI002ED0DF48
MAAEEEKQSEATDGEQEEAAKESPSKEKKPKKARKTKEKTDESSDGKEKPKKTYPRNMDNPSIHDMVIEALDVLEERKGVTLIAIKRYLEDNYKVDTVKQAAHIRKIITKCVDDGDIIRTRGAGCSGRFKVKHTKPSVIKKRRAPEDYQELPNPPKSKPRPKPAKKKETTTTSTTPKKGAIAAKKTPSKVTPKKKGRLGRKK